jgi:IS30 family transposase
MKKLMRYKWKYGKRKGADNRGKIADTKSIRKRPAGATNRTRYGHWESDTVLGKRKTGCIATHVERKSGYLVAIALPDRREGIVSSATTDAFAALPSRLKKSFTVDNGKEFADHKLLSELTGMDVYFCDPCSPWQRGTNENTNGLIRQFFPKGSSFEDLPGGKLEYVVQLINERPRKRLGFKSPSEVVSKFFLL